MSSAGGPRDVCGRVDGRGVMTKLRKMIGVLANRCELLSDLPHALRTFLILFDPYRPELHYMRGPGPKWHAKHGKR
jgi:hypothetical protein